MLRSVTSSSSYRAGSPAAKSRHPASAPGCCSSPSSPPPREAAAAVVGKIAPYVAIFLVWGALATIYLAAFRGWPVEGSVGLLLAGYVGLYLAYAGMATLIVGLTLSMGQALSMTALYAGASFAFAGAVFPIESASAFARVWSALLPYTTFARLVAEQWMMGAPAAMSVSEDSSYLPRSGWVMSSRLIVGTPTK